MKIKQLEQIYKNVTDEYDNISNFYNLTLYTYDIALKSVNNTDKKEVGESTLDEAHDSSFSPADIKINDIKKTCEWISLDAYAKKTGTIIETIEEKSQSGDLGEVREKNGVKFVIWPPEKAGNENLPPLLDEQNYEMEVVFEETISTKEGLTLGEIYSLLGPKDVLTESTSQAALLLNRETFLLYWSTFEQYIKNLTASLFDLFPEQVFNNRKYGKNQMTYLEIFEGSSRFTNIQELKERIIDSIIGNPNTEKESIFKMITFIRDCYLTKDVDPYNTWYVFKGNQETIDSSVINQIRILRNAIVHHNGEMKEGWDTINLIKQPDDNRVVVDEDLLLKTKLILQAISYNIFNLITENELFGLDNSTY